MPLNVFDCQILLISKFLLKFLNKEGLILRALLTNIRSSLSWSLNLRCNWWVWKSWHRLRVTCSHWLLRKGSSLEFPLLESRRRKLIGIHKNGIILLRLSISSIVLIDLLLLWRLLYGNLKVLVLKLRGTHWVIRVWVGSPLLIYRLSYWILLP